jgi:hypothetical protein
VKFSFATSEALQITNVLMEHRHTGYSVSVGGFQPVSGYMVGGEVESLVLPAEGSHYLSTDDWLIAHWDLLSKPGYFAGVWTDSESGDVYVDISRNVDDLYTALAIAAARKELAIWDVANSVEIRTEESGAVLSDRL